MLTGQLDSARAIRTFASNLALFSGTLAGSDAALRQVIDNGSATATQLRTFLEDNDVELGELINDLVTTGEVVVKNIRGVEQILAVYPYVVEGGFTVVSKYPRPASTTRTSAWCCSGAARRARTATRAPTYAARTTAATGRMNEGGALRGAPGEEQRTGCPARASARGSGDREPRSATMPRRGP